MKRCIGYVGCTGLQSDGSQCESCRNHNNNHNNANDAKLRILRAMGLGYLQDSDSHTWVKKGKPNAVVHAVDQIAGGLWFEPSVYQHEIELTDEQIQALVDKAAERAITKTDKTILKKVLVFVRGTWQKDHKKFWFSKLPKGYSGDQELMHFIEVGEIRRRVRKALVDGESVFEPLRILYNPFNTTLGPDWLNNRLGRTLKLTEDGKVYPVNGYTYDQAALDGLNLHEYRLPIPLKPKQIEFAKQAGVL